jgi:pyrroline-5-carboxylate reductase
MREYGFIGVGNMAGAMIGGLLQSKKADASQIIGSCKSAASREKAEALYQIAMTGDNREVAKEAGTLFLCVKPQFLDGVIDEIKDVIRPDQLVVSIVAGRSLAYYQKALYHDVRLIRLMPNTPALVGEGMTAACASESVSQAQMQAVADLCRTFGRFEVVPESLFDVVTAVSGSSPAYIFMIMEAMADAAVLGGMPRAQAYQFVGQAVLGSAKMMLETGKHPGELKDMVCSPAGTTIEAVRVLEEKGLRTAVIEGTRACMEKSAMMNASKS